MEYNSIYEVTTCHSREEELDWHEQRGREAYFTGRVDEELGSFISTIDSNTP